MNRFPKFVKGFGPPMISEPASPKVLKTYKERLPGPFLDFATEHGFCAWGEGILWTVNPESLQDVLEDWLDEPQEAAVFARTAFGELFLWQDDAAWYLNVQRGTVSKVISKIEVFFEGFPLDQKVIKSVLRKPEFDKALKRHGPLAADECYAFTPALALGGEAKAENTKKSKLREYLSILAGLQE